MIRIAHLADTHLGYKQYNLDEREQDLYDVLDETADKVLKERVDILIHSGDLFESARPTTRAYYEFKKFLSKLDGKIKIFTILGDHDTPKRRGMPPHMLFEDRIEILGITGADHRILRIDGEEVLIAGISHFGRRYRDLLIQELEKLDSLAAKYTTSILMLHQAIEKFFTREEVFELRLDEVPRNFRYCAMGHLHTRVRASHGDGELAYSGSTEIIRRDEIVGWEKHGKGCHIIDIDDEKIQINEFNAESIRPQMQVKLHYSNFQNDLETLVNSIQKSTKLPIVHANVEGKEIDRQYVYQALTEALADKALQIRPEINEAHERQLEEIKPGSFNINQILKEYLKDETTAELGYELFKLLRYGEVEEAKKVAEEYFSKEEKNTDIKKG